MLVVSRKPKGRLRIGDEIMIEIIKVSDEQVSIGIKPPKHIITKTTSQKLPARAPAINKR